MRRPRLLDLFSCAGGAAMGYHRAGFEVIGVDIAPQPRYPFEHHQADALEFLAGHWREFDAIHASPPCHDHTSLTSVAGMDGTGWLLEATRDALSGIGRPWVIENVPGAEMRVDLMLCGSMFGLRTYRHRWFEFGDPMLPPTLAHPRHVAKTSTKRRRTCWEAGMNISVTGDIGRTIGSLALGIDWMNGNELSQAIPPAYTEHVGEHLLAQVAEMAVTR
ncbi:DNA (cytosine-5)-methyltransferase 1 [Catenulispora sp. MAP12-49]|uniref:DNA cytosine methyltransferase n=1 Tax=Catenulispora sp. MAP12-49 TaxID=3156302 RepID=UPI003513A82A